MWGRVRRVIAKIDEADQPGHVEHPVVHLPALGAPGHGVAQLVEQGTIDSVARAVLSEPTRPHLQPGAVTELATLGVVEQ